MALPRSDKPEWVQVTQRRQELVVLSEPTPWVSHWDTAKMRSRRCGGKNCQLCQFGMPKQIRYILLCVDSHCHERLLELRERHADYLDRLISEHGSTVGLRVSVLRDGTAKNSPVSFRFLARESVVSRDIKLLVERFGLPPLLVEAIPEKNQSEDLINNSEDYLEDAHV
jgi:hypothetical protein